MQDKQIVWDGPIIDNHFHLNRNGRFLEAAKDFKNAGGTGIVLVHCPDFSNPPTTKQGHTETYRDTINMAEMVRKEHGLGVRVVLGPHPAAFAHQFIDWIEKDPTNGSHRAIQNYRDSIDAALEFVHEGLAHAIGEVGRPHWPVSDEVWRLSNQLLEETMHLAAQMKRKYESDNSFTYDAVIRSRPDFLHLHTDIEEYFDDLENVCYHINTGKTYSPNRIYSMFLLGNSKTMDILCNCWEDYGKLAETNHSINYGKYDACRMMYAQCIENQIRIQSFHRVLGDCFRLENYSDYEFFKNWYS